MPWKERLATQSGTRVTRKASPGSLGFLELALQDKIDRCKNKNLSVRLDRAGFDEAHTLEDFDSYAPVRFDRDRVRDGEPLGKFLTGRRVVDGTERYLISVGAWKYRHSSGRTPSRGGHAGGKRRSRQGFPGTPEVGLVFPG